MSNTYRVHYGHWGITAMEGARVLTTIYFPVGPQGPVENPAIRERLLESLHQAVQEIVGERMDRELSVQEQIRAGVEVRYWGTATEPTPPSPLDDPKTFQRENLP